MTQHSSSTYPARADKQLACPTASLLAPRKHTAALKLLTPGWPGSYSLSAAWWSVYTQTRQQVWVFSVLMMSVIAVCAGPGQPASGLPGAPPCCPEFAVDLALAHGKPFAVVPCCVFSSEKPRCACTCIMLWSLPNRRKRCPLQPYHLQTPGMRTERWNI
jgi:hypothetical protein